MSTIHVAPSGFDHASGLADAPLATITAGCNRARPGDTVLVHAGVYREWVDPPRGGWDDHHRVTIAAAPGEHVVISGAEPLDAWQSIGDGLWTRDVPDTWFRGTTTLRTELFGDWFWHKHQPQHLGELFIDGVPMIEVADKTAVRAREPWPDAADPTCTRLAWCVTAFDRSCRITAHFDGRDPNDALVELSVREACVYPRRTGINWITLRGIECRQAASPWAPPTAEQIGMVGPHWSQGWRIESCHLHHARCAGISLGAPAFIGDNRWSREQVKHGTQREREVVFTALHHGWSRDTIGSHVIVGCHIHDCEQAGIVGHLGGVFSHIHHNHIHHCHVRRRFGGHEMAGIKLHAAIDCRIEHNHFHDNVRGLWLDWQAQGARVHGNLFHHHPVDDVYIEVSHGPTIVDHNVLLSAVAVNNCSQGTAFVHNLIAGAVTMSPIPIRYTPYHLPHSTAVAGLMTILGGDDRWLNNCFVSPAATADAVTVEDENADLARDVDAPVIGLAAYDDWPAPDEDWVPSGGVPAYAAAKLPVWIAGNVYTAGSAPCRHDPDAAVSTDPLTWTLTPRDGRMTLALHGSGDLPTSPTLAPDCLGSAFQPECPFEDPSGELVDWTTDVIGDARSGQTPPGPCSINPLAKHDWVIGRSKPQGGDHR